MKSAKTYTRGKTSRRRSPKTRKRPVIYQPIRGGDGEAEGETKEPDLTQTEEMNKAIDFVGNMSEGIIGDIKNAIAQKASFFFRGNVTGRIDSYFLSKLPKMFRRRIMAVIDVASYKMVNDMVGKGANVAENMIKALPGAGNMVSLGIAGDKAYAAAQNLLAGMNMVRDEILKMKQELVDEGLDPDAILPIYIPPIPKMPKISLPGLTPGEDPFGDQIEKAIMEAKMAKKNNASASSASKMVRKSRGGGTSDSAYMKCIKHPGASSNACQDILQRTETSIESFRGGGEQNKNTHIQCVKRSDGSSVCHDILQRTHASIREFRDN